MRHIIPISGKDSAATALVQMAREPSLPYESDFAVLGAESSPLAWKHVVRGYHVFEAFADANNADSKRRFECRTRRACASLSVTIRP